MSGMKQDGAMEDQKYRWVVEYMAGTIDRETGASDELQVVVEAKDIASALYAALDLNDEDILGKFPLIRAELITGIYLA